MGCPFCEKGTYTYTLYTVLVLLTTREGYAARYQVLSFDILGYLLISPLICSTEIRRLVELANKPENTSITFIIITHSVSTYQLHEFIHNELKLDPLPSNITLFGDAERKVYAAHGLGELSLLNVINRDILKQVMDLKNNEGIANRLTRGTR